MAGKTKADYEKDYTRPDLREKLKQQIMDSDKGGRPGQWSARKSQLLTHEYEKQGGGYKHDDRTRSQQSLSKWTAQDWQTSSGSARARHGKSTDRYLPKDAWDKLSPEEKQQTNARKRSGSRKGKQFVANPAPAKDAAKASSKPASKAPSKAADQAADKAARVVKRPAKATTARRKTAM